jgi:hypothetical protein
MRRALAIDEKSYGPEHPDVARDLNNLAALLEQNAEFAAISRIMVTSLQETPLLMRSRRFLG